MQSKTEIEGVAQNLIKSLLEALESGALVIGRMAIASLIGQACGTIAVCNCDPESSTPVEPLRGDFETLRDALDKIGENIDEVSGTAYDGLMVLFENAFKKGGERAEKLLK